MSASPHEPSLSPEARWDSFWLPPGTEGNGLPAARWAQIVVVSHGDGARLLAAFRAAGIPARMALDRHLGGDAADTRVWVDPERYGDAENVLLREQPH